MKINYSLTQLSDTLKAETFTICTSRRNEKDVFSFRLKKYIYLDRVEYEISTNVWSDYSYLESSHNKPVLDCAKERFEKVYSEAQAYFQNLFELKGGHK